jgi:hypothetical protein
LDIPAATGNSDATVSTPTLPNPLTSAYGDASFSVIIAVKVATNTNQVGNLLQARTANIETSKARVIHA